MKLKKPILLFLALLLPACIFVFLKKFGKNEFDVPAFYQTEKPAAPSDCSSNYELPYRVPANLMSELKSAATKPLYLVSYSEMENLSRVRENYGPDIAMVRGAQLLHDSRRCIFFMKDYQDVVLLDEGGNIRGYYTSTDREDVDRLLLELDILLKRY